MCFAASAVALTGAASRISPSPPLCPGRQQAVSNIFGESSNILSISRSTLQQYAGRVSRSRRAVIVGPSCSGKSYLATKLAEFSLLSQVRSPRISRHSLCCRNTTLWLSNCLNLSNIPYGQSSAKLPLIQSLGHLVTR